MSKSKAPAVFETSDAQDQAAFERVMKNWDGKPLTSEQARALPPPCFSITELRNAIPKHCFQRSTVRSLTYVARDVAGVVGLAYLTSVLAEILPIWLRATVLWPAYWFVSGCLMTGLWVIAHECGHRSFSDSNAWNDGVGMVLHSMLLVPYHSWRISHGMHHKNTARMEGDQVFLPATKAKIRKARLEAAAEDAPITSLIGVLSMLLIGWPGYLLFNFSGQDYGRRTNHFEPSSPIFKPSQAKHVINSDLGLVAAFAILYVWAQTYSWSHVFCYYFMPYLWTNAWLVSITFLQHTHADIPHYRDGKWNFVRGALATIDRDVGILNSFHHHIADTHVAHHMFSQMPHYHAEEATEALKKVLGPYYRRSNENFAVALYNVWRSCEFVSDEGLVLYYETPKTAKSE